jgi:hypothetical protein
VSELPDERPVMRADLCDYFRVKSEDTIRRWAKTGVLPPPDVQIDRRNWGWRRQTLEAAGLPMKPLITPKPTYQFAPPAFHLYRHFDAEGTLLYVGISISALNRLAGHRGRAPWYWNIARVEVTRYATRRESLDAEREAVKTERPLFNIQHAERDE